jgi:octaprenyl-diphosphate synthase
MKPAPPLDAGTLKRTRPDLGRIYAGITRDLVLVERKLKQVSRSNVPLIAEIGRYLFQKSGKRIRPALVLLSSRLFEARSPEKILLASLVELVHTSSLIHDDIIDNADIRRGKPTLHTKWGPNVTVLLGDHLYIRSISLSLESRLPGVTALLAGASVRMIEGEIKEYELNGHLDLKEKDYLDIIDRKTAALFAASCRLGGILGRAGRAEDRALLDYGLNLGLCFQMVDDILDYTGDEDVLGKPVLSDLAEGRITLPLIRVLSRDGTGPGRRIKSLLKDGRREPGVRREIADLVRSEGGLDYARERAAAFCRKAKDSLARLPESAPRESLGLLADFILAREK